MRAALVGTADNADALTLLKRAARGDAYEKVQDAKWFWRGPTLAVSPRILEVSGGSFA